MTRRWYWINIRPIMDQSGILQKIYFSETQNSSRNAWTSSLKVFMPMSHSITFLKYLSRALQRNPLFPKNFLTAGDWSLKIWSEDICVSPLQWVWAGQHRVTSATWSPVRQGWLQTWILRIKVYIKVANNYSSLKHPYLDRPSYLPQEMMGTWW